MHLQPTASCLIDCPWRRSNTFTITRRLFLILVSDNVKEIDPGLSQSLIYVSMQCFTTRDPHNSCPDLSHSSLQVNFVVSVTMMCLCTVLALSLSTVPSCSQTRSTSVPWNGRWVLVGLWSLIALGVFRTSPLTSLYTKVKETSLKKQKKENIHELCVKTKNLSWQPS